MAAYGALTRTHQRPEDIRGDNAIMPRDAHGDKRGRNDPCWCGSGRKFKHCHLNRREDKPVTRNEALQGLFSSFKHKECSCPKDWKHQCSGEIVRAHSLSRRNALAVVTEAGHVFSLLPDWAQLFHKDKFVFKRKSAREASTFTGFCGYHDNSIFLELDNNDFDGSIKPTFLSAYRTLCREIFVKRGHLSTTHLGRTMDKGRSPDRQILIQETMLATYEGASAALCELEELKSYFEAALTTSRYDKFSFVNFHFGKQPDLVSAGGFNPSHDLSGNFLQSLDIDTQTENVFFSILPAKDGFWASFLWLRKHSLLQRFVQDVENNFCNPGGVYGVALSHIENTFIRPSFWDALPEARKAEFHYLMMMGVLHHNHGKAREVAARLGAQYSAPADRILRG